MIQVQAWQVDYHQGKLDLGLLLRTDKLKGILKLYRGGGLCPGVVSIQGSLCPGVLRQEGGSLSGRSP